jgi:hypothetical protein
MATTETFNFAYDLQFIVNPLTGGLNFKVKDDNPSKNGVQAAADTIVVNDPDGGTIETGQNLALTNPGNGSITEGSYTFIGTVNVTDDDTENAPLGTISGIVVEDNSTGKFYLLTDTPYVTNLNGGNGLVSFTSGVSAICFMAGTLIRTLEGEVAVETLKPGSQVLTHDGRTATVDWLGIQTISLRFADKLRVLPIRIKAGALGDNVPSRDLLVSPDHALLVEGALIHAGALVNGSSIVRETDVPRTFIYYHVEVEDHSLILAENTPAETFVDNIDRMHFDNWAEHEALYPEGKPINELPYPRAKSHRQVPVSTRVMLAARAQALFGSADDSAAA